MSLRGNDFREAYYEQEMHWSQGHHLTPLERERVGAAVTYISSDVLSILDVGCGSGVFLDALRAEYPKRFSRLIGIDRFHKPLAYVRETKACADISAPPFKDKSFDLVSALEVLEHVPYNTFPKALYELQRVSKKYILITVPNSQNLDNFLLVCPECHCHFNPFLHLRSFTEDSLRSLFKWYELSKLVEVGEVVLTNSFDRVISMAARILGKCSPPPRCICPQCGYRREEAGDPVSPMHPTPLEGLGLARKLKFLSRMFLPTKKRKGWLLALYIRRSNCPSPLKMSG